MGIGGVLVAQSLGSTVARASDIKETSREMRSFS